MADYELIYSESADEDIQSLSEIKDQIEKKIRYILENPSEVGRPLGGRHAGSRSLRVGPKAKFRIIYRVNEQTKTIEILKVGPRESDTPQRDVYT